MRRSEALRKAIDTLGSSLELAKRIGVTPQAISQWEDVPVLRVAAVETATGISRHELRPDIFGPVPSDSHASEPEAA